MPWNDIAKKLLPEGSEPQLDSLTQLLEASAGERLQALAVLRFLESLKGPLAGLTERFRFLAQTCGSWSAAKLALSLLREPLATPSQELHQALRSNHCVPAAIRLCEALRQSGCQDEARRLLALEAAALLSDGARQQVELLQHLLESATPEALESLAYLARQLRLVGWEACGSWGLVEDPQRGLVINDGAHPEQREAFGMTYTSEPICLEGQIRSRLQFMARLEILGLTDRCHLEVSSDGQEWVKLTKFDGVQEWANREVDLSAFDGQTIRLRFHVISGHDRQGGGVFLDRLCLTGVLPDRSLALGWQTQGWEKDVVVSGSEVPWACSSPDDNHLTSLPIALDAIDSPTLLLSYRLQTSSLYERCGLELKVDDQDWQEVTIFETGEGRRTIDLAPYQGSSVRLRFSTNLNPRRPGDGFYLTRLKLVGTGTSHTCHRLAPLDGSPEDGQPQREALRQLALAGRFEELGHLARLVEQLKSVACALSFLPHLQNEQDLRALLVLHLAFKERAGDLFEQLRASSRPDEDLERLARLMVLTGPEGYLGARDLLGEGLFSPGEVDANIDFYLELARVWGVEMAESAFNVLLVPVAAESLAERRQAFAQLVTACPDEPDEALRDWGLVTRWTGEQSLGEAMGCFVEQLAAEGQEKARDHLAQAQRVAS
ncbi:MAG: hypothetical protein KC910_18020 [Candidatus Eremiobacteraeota bacterium]|nr:hypothetical protein [Candidatus Eremiobacteraeota bacterium]